MNRAFSRKIGDYRARHHWPATSCRRGGLAGSGALGEAETVLQRDSNREVFTQKPQLGDVAALCGIGSFLILMVNLIHSKPHPGT